jgi:WD40 repeat protein
MRSRPYVLALSALFLNTAALGQEMSPKPEPREGVPNDKCVIELNLPNQATVRIDDRDYGEQRSITLPIPKPPLNRDGFGRPCFFLSVGFSNDGRRSMTVEVKGGTVVRVALSAPPIEPVLLEGPSDDITSLAFSPDGKWIATGTYDQQAILWETSTGWIRWNGDVPWCNAAESSVSVAFSPDGAQLLVAHECTGVAILDAATGKRLRDLSQALNEDGPGGANAVALSRDGRMVVAALSWRVKPLAVIWDRKSGRRLKILTGPKRPADQSVHDFRSIAVTPDSRYVVAALDEATVVLDISTGKMLRTFPSNSGSVLSVAISPDGT